MRSRILVLGSATAAALVGAVPLLAALFLSACGGGSSPTSPEPRRDDLVLLKIEPADGTALRIGDTVPITATLRYSFAEASAGNITILPYPGDVLPIGPPLFAFPFRIAVQGRQGETTLRSQVLLDDSELQPGRLTVSFTLFPAGNDRSQTFIDAHYQLVR